MSQKLRYLIPWPGPQVMFVIRIREEFPTMDMQSSPDSVYQIFITERKLPHTNFECEYKVQSIEIAQAPSTTEYSFISILSASQWYMDFCGADPLHVTKN